VYFHHHKLFWAVAQPGSDLSDGTAVEYCFPSLPLFPLLALLPLFSLFLEVGPLKSSYRVWGSAVSSHSRVSWSRIWCILALKYDIWWHHFGPTVVDSYAKPLVHYWPRSTYVLNWQNCIGINVWTHAHCWGREAGWVKAERMHIVR